MTHCYKIFAGEIAASAIQELGSRMVFVNLFPMNSHGKPTDSVHSMDRRAALKLNLSAFSLYAAQTSFGFLSALDGQPSSAFSLKYILSSAMYGTLPIGDVLREVHRIGAEEIDIWPRVHANHREQIEEIGQDQFGRLLQENHVSLGCVTRYDLGPFGIHRDFEFAGRFGCPRMVCGGAGPKGLSGPELKSAVLDFVGKMKPQCEKASEKGITIAIENHGNNLIDSPDSLRWLAEASEAEGLNVGIALAPYHLENLGLDATDIAGLIRDLSGHISIFYAWQYGMGCMKKLPKHQELLQMPGRGDMDFQPIVNALKETGYSGVVSIFMHPVPRGIPAVDGGAEAVTTLINSSREYLNRLLQTPS